MSRLCRVIIIFLLIFASLHMVAFVIDVQADPCVVVVPDDFPTLQEAINAANQTDTIYVKNGVFYGTVVINKTLTIMGENRAKTIIDCNETSSCTIVVTANNSVLSDFTVQNGFFGFMLKNVSNVTIKNIDIKDSKYGVSIRSSSNNTISGCHLVFSLGRGLQTGFEIILNSSNNNICGNDILPGALFSQTGISLGEASHNVISGNNVHGHNYGMYISLDSSNNIICGNNITSNNYGIYTFGTNDKFYHNNFIGNNVHASGLLENSIWDDGYPSGGNYWNGYTTSFDAYSGPNQNLPGSDGIGDFPAYLAADSFPLMGMFSDFDATSEYNVQTVCNSTISDFQFNGTAIAMNVSGENGTTGFCRVCVPTALMNDTYKVFVDGAEVNSTLLPCSDINNSYLYFSYKLSTKNTLKDHADLNKDGVVNVLDMCILSTAWNSTPGDPEWKPEADLNNDGVIDALDMTLLVSVIGETTNIATHEVTIIPEFPSLLILPPFMLATLLPVIVYKRKHAT